MKKKTLLKKNALIIIFQFCLFGLSPGNCTMAIQSLSENHQNLVKKMVIFL